MNDIKKIIDEWDPIDLFPFAPADEYIREVELIEAHIMTTQNLNEVAEEIQKIFVSRFGEHDFRKNFDECLEIAYEILEVK